MEVSVDLVEASGGEGEACCRGGVEVGEGLEVDFDGDSGQRTCFHLAISFCSLKLEEEGGMMPRQIGRKRDYQESWNATSRSLFDR